MPARHVGQPLPIATNVSTQLSQKRACPQGTSAIPVLVATKQTSQVDGALADVAAD